jgi:hypothetical protein
LNERPQYERQVAAARAGAWKATGDDATFATAWAEGRAMTLEQAIEYALEKGGDCSRLGGERAIRRPAGA